MKKFISLLLIGIMLFTQIQFTSAENVSLSVSQQKLYDKVFPRLKTMVDQKDDTYRLKVISTLEKAQKNTKNTDQQIVLGELIKNITLTTTTITTTKEDTDTDSRAVWLMKSFINSFDQVTFIKFTNEELDNNRKTYVDEVALSSSLGFQHNEKNFTFPPFKDDKNLRNQLQKHLDDYSNVMKKKSQLRCYLQPIPLEQISNDESLVIGSTKSNYAVNVRNPFLDRGFNPIAEIANHTMDSAMRNDYYYNLQKKQQQEKALLMTTVIVSGINSDGNKEIKAFPVKIGASSEIQLAPTLIPSFDIYAKNLVFSTIDKSREFTTLASTQLVIDNTSPFRFVSLVSETAGGPGNLSVLACDYSSNKAFVPAVTGEKPVEITYEDAIAKLEKSCQDIKNKENPNWNSGGYVNDYLNNHLFNIWNPNDRKYEEIPVLFSGLLNQNIYGRKKSELESLLAKSPITDYCTYTPNPCNSKYIGTKQTIGWLDLAYGSVESKAQFFKEFGGVNFSYKFSIGKIPFDTRDYNPYSGQPLMGNKSCTVEISSDNGRINKRFTVIGIESKTYHGEDDGKMMVSELK